MGHLHQTGTRLALGTDGVCAVTTLGGNLDGHAKHVVGWRSTNLFPQTAKAKIINCSTGRRY